MTVYERVPYNTDWNCIGWTGQWCHSMYEEPEWNILCMRDLDHPGPHVNNNCMIAWQEVFDENEAINNLKLMERSLR